MKDEILEQTANWLWSIRLRLASWLIGDYGFIKNITTRGLIVRNGERIYIAGDVRVELNK